MDMTEGTVKKVSFYNKLTEYITQYEATQDILTQKKEYLNMLYDYVMGLAKQGDLTKQLNDSTAKTKLQILLNYTLDLLKQLRNKDAAFEQERKK